MSFFHLFLLELLELGRREQIRNFVQKYDYSERCFVLLIFVVYFHCPVGKFHTVLLNLAERVLRRGFGLTVKGR